jgi:plastocyanin
MPAYLTAILVTPTMKPTCCSLILLTAVACVARVGERLPDGGLPNGFPGGVVVNPGLSAPEQCQNTVLDLGEVTTDCGGPCSGCEDAGGTPSGLCESNYAGCVQFDDQTAQGSSRRITFGNNHQYDPKCMRVRLGQTVTLEGNFSEHGLLPVCGPSAVFPAVSSGSQANVVLNAIGVYGYYCDQHGSSSGTGMAGAIQVVE